LEKIQFENDLYEFLWDIGNYMKKENFVDGLEDDDVLRFILTS
jgi:hypothetical protein